MNPGRKTLPGIVMIVLAFTVGRTAGAANEDKNSPATTVDAGSFGVFKNSHRLATEKFSIQESAAGKSVSSEVTTEAGSQKSEQSCDLRLSPNGDLVSYEWREKSPGSAQITVTPKDEFLIERSLLSKGDTKPADQTFLMPVSTMVLDNNFFVLRQVLAWRYLALSCKTENDATKCSKEAARVGVIVPQDHISMSTTVRLVGTEKVRVGQTERQLLRLDLNDDNGLWQLWLDGQDKFKLVRIVIAADGTEIVRD